MIRVFLVDDYDIVRRGVRDLLRATDDIEVAGEASTASEARQTIPSTDADIVVMDVRLPDGDGIDLWRDLRNERPDLRCLVMTAFDDDEARLAAIVSGANGFLLKDVRGVQLVDAIRRIARGGSMFTASSEAQIRARIARPAPKDPRTACLSRQEHRILQLLVEGLTNRQMAADMGLTEKTVKNYVSNLLVKLGMQCRTEAAVYAARLDDARMVEQRMIPLPMRTGSRIDLVSDSVA